MMQRLQPEVREANGPFVREIVEHLRIEIPSRVDRRPAGSDEVTRMKHGCWQAPSGCLIEQVPFDDGLAAAVVAERPPWGVFRRGPDDDNAHSENLVSLSLIID